MVEYTLDPEDWEKMRALGHRMLDDMMNHLKNVRERPIFRQIPDKIIALFKQPPPMEGEGAEATYEDFVELVLGNQSNFNIDPRFWGFVVGTGSPTGMLADMLASGLNVNMVGGPLVSTMIEMQVTGWLKGLMGFPMDSGGILVTGGSMATLLGLTVARNTMSEINLRQRGVQSLDRKMTLYASEEVHACVQKSAEMLGLGNENLRRVPADDEYRMDVTALREMIENDMEAGYRPFCVVGCAGTVNTGAFDQLDAIADVCAEEKLWFHVDGAFGAWANIVPSLEYLVKGMERADSLALDLHKWMYMPYDVGCVLFRNISDQFKTFSERPDYYGMSLDVAPQFADLGFELSRSFRALKVWMGLKEHGVSKYSSLIQQNVDQARYLAELVEEKEELELMAPVPLNIVCFRYRDPELMNEALDELNDQLLRRLMFSGAGAPSETKIKGRHIMRACITNHRTTRGDLETFAESAVMIGRAMAEEMKKHKVA